MQKDKAKNHSWTHPLHKLHDEYLLNSETTPFDRELPIAAATALLDAMLSFAEIHILKKIARPAQLRVIVKHRNGPAWGP